ncbi:unnamed protein product [Didymodactylos carnosus]|uniref:SSD domain-containing protein n=1 Tax=Didymodactylos carnosus TaxID=1234261 RepID=A0A8S2DKX6_9BILA|nr:unnamed protein product [Didymodactylos carnosus]CAF3712601.1 unnamed protein product [Didymodactylos carnosus]
MQARFRVLSSFQGWGARGPKTIFSQLMVLRHASEKFRLAYDLPLEKYELFDPTEQFEKITTSMIKHESYNSTILAKNDMWKDKDYNLVSEMFYEEHADESGETPDYSDTSLYTWNKERHYGVYDRIIKYVDDKTVNITVDELVRNLPQFETRLPFDLLKSYVFLLDEQYRGQIGRDGMIEFFMERVNSDDDILTLPILYSICSWEERFKKLLNLDNVKSLSLARLVALYNNKTNCHSLTLDDIQRFRQILTTCVPYYINGYMEFLSDNFLNRVATKRDEGITHQEQTKSLYAALRHTCFYRNYTRFIFDHFVDRDWIRNLYDDYNKTTDKYPKVASTMIYITNYQSKLENQSVHDKMCMKRLYFDRTYCLNRGCLKDYVNNALVSSCNKWNYATRKTMPINCKQYCECAFHCENQTKEFVTMEPIYKSKELIVLFEQHFAGKRQMPSYRDEHVKLVALNFANVRERAAMSRISEDMLLVLIAMALIMAITILYLRSVSIALIIIISCAMSIGVSYFIYSVIYRIPIFPFMNLMSAFILIGIGCDDIFVFFDTWEQEKREWLRRKEDENKNAQIIPLTIENKNGSIIDTVLDNKFKLRKSYSHRLSDNHHPEETRQMLLNSEALIEIMSKTLKHAASSMFVTSFTTSAAFFTNMLTNISFVQVFGVFTGTCILLYFIITITAIAAFCIIYELYIQDIISKLSKCFSSRSTAHITVNPSTNSTTKLFKRISLSFNQFRTYLFCYSLPKIIIALRYILVLLFLPMGILGIIGVFHYPKLKVPSTQKVTFFLKDNPMEIYEFQMKKIFEGHSKEEKRLFAYPSISFIFGIVDRDDGYRFDMNDRGKLHLKPLYLNHNNTLEFFKNFTAILGTRTDLFSSNYDLEQDFKQFLSLASDEILITKAADDKAKLNMSSTTYEQMIKFLAQSDINIIRVLVNKTIRGINYQFKDDFSDDEDYINIENDTIDKNVVIQSINELINKNIINYRRYRKNFNKTLQEHYKDQLKSMYNQDQLKNSLTKSYRDQEVEEHQNNALKTAFSCLSGEAGLNNVPPEFCERQINYRRSINWAVLPEKLENNNIRPFAVIITIRGNLNQTDYDSYNDYYFRIKNFFDPYIKNYAPEHLKHAWFSSPGFAFYGVQRELLVGSYSSLVASLGIALLVLFLTSGNLFIAFYALVTITFAIAVSIAMFAAFGWELGIIEAIIVIMSVGLSVDFTVHFGVAYIHTNGKDIRYVRQIAAKNYAHKTLKNALSTNDNDKTDNCFEMEPEHLSTEEFPFTYRQLLNEHQAEREMRVQESVARVGSAVFMAAFTTFAAGFSMTLSSLSSFRQMGQFLMTIMLTSYVFATFFFLPLCAIMGPVGNCGSIPFSTICSFFKDCWCRRRSSQSLPRVCV